MTRPERLPRPRHPEMLPRPRRPEMLPRPPRLPADGGPYAYSRVAFGNRLGFFNAWSYWISAWGRRRPPARHPRVPHAAGKDGRARGPAGVPL